MSDTRARAPFSASIRERWPELTDAEAVAVVRALAAGYEDARDAYPDVELDEVLYGEYAVKRAKAAADVEALCLADLYLAGACAAGVAHAVDSLVRGPLHAVTALLIRSGEPEAEVNDAAQALLAKLTVGASGGGRIVQYDGRGNLRAWLRVAASRELLMLRRGKRRESTPLDGRDAIAVVDPGSDPELAHLQRLYKDEFKAAFEEAFAALPPRERTLLRQQVIDRLTVLELAALHNVHRATVLRWLAATREALFESTGAALERRLSLKPEELRSLYRLVRSQLDVSVQRLLAPSAASPAKP